MGDLSLHIDAQHNWEYAKTILASPNIRSALLMNASPDQVSYALLHADFVVVRLFDPFNEHRGGQDPDFEKKILERHSPQEFVAALDNQGFGRFKHNEKLRFVVGWNEVYSKRGQAERTQNAKIIAIADAMINAGYGVGLGAWAAAKSFYQDDVDNGHWDDLIRFSVANRDMVSFDLHEYEVLRTAGQHLKSYPDGYPDSLLNIEAMKKENWGVVNYDGKIDNDYHIGRVDLLLARSEQITGDRFGFYRGECAHDYLDDGPLKQFLETKINSRFGRPTGVNSLQSYYTYLAGGNLSNDDYNRMLYEDYEWLAANDGGAIANFIFAHNGSSQWVQFNTANANRNSFVSRIMNHVSTSNPMPDNPPTFNFSPDDFVLYNMRSNTGGNVRVRDTYGLNSVVQSVFFTPQYQEIALVHPNRNIPQYPPIANGFTWVYVIFNNGVAGWSALDLLEIEAVVDDTDYKAMIEAIRAIVCE
jgi:hypothetical protein